MMRRELNIIGFPRANSDSPLIPGSLVDSVLLSHWVAQILASTDLAAVKSHGFLLIPANRDSISARVEEEEAVTNETSGSELIKPDIQSFVARLVQFVFRKHSIRDCPRTTVVATMLLRYH
uniref:Uncharacterized protein n=1 Tax=Entomoneis paludosa TaxID=265537 RepID=A0A7S2VCS1_9STRA